MKSAPTLGSLALQQRTIDANALDEVLRVQRQSYTVGDYRRLGQILVDHGHCRRGVVRSLLARQGITVVVCSLCGTRYNVVLFRNRNQCLRCGSKLAATEESAPLTVEDVLSGGGADADQLLAEHRQRNPRLGPYEVLGEVGRGNMGVIYKAWEERLQRYVALKFLLPTEAANSEDRERFRREARAVARLRHENIVQVHAIEERGGSLYLAMDFVPGVALVQLAQRGQLDRAQAVQVGVQIAAALQYAHDEGIVHRDVKPQNIILDRNGKPYLVDFGIAKDRSEAFSLTTEEEVLGSLAYMAPEYVIKGKSALDHRCDVYGLGAALYEVLSGGYLPYGDPADPGMIRRLYKEEPIPLQDVAPDLPPGLGEVVMRALAREKDARYPTAAAMGQELQAVLERMGGPVAPAVVTPAPSSSRVLPAVAAPTPGSPRRPSGEYPAARRPSDSALPAPASPRRPSGEHRRPSDSTLPTPAAGQRPSRRSTPRTTPSSAPPATPAEPSPPPARPAPAPVPPPITGVGPVVLHRERQRGPWALALTAIVTLVLLALWVQARGESTRSGQALRVLQVEAGKTYLELGRLRELRGDPAGAAEAIERSLQLLPDDPGPLEARARLRRAQGDTAGAEADAAAAAALRAR